MVLHFTKRKDGEQIKVQVSVSAIEYENKRARLALLIDRTDQEKARKDLLQLNIQLRQLAARLQEIREDERTNMAREIHDELGSAVDRPEDGHCLAEPETGERRRKHTD